MKPATLPRRLPRSGSEAWRYSDTRGWSARKMFLVLQVLAANLNGNVDDDDVDDHANPDEGRDQADVLGDRCAGEEKHADTLATRRRAVS